MATFSLVCNVATAHERTALCTRHSPDETPADLLLCYLTLACCSLSHCGSGMRSCLLLLLSGCLQCIDSQQKALGSC